MDEKTTENNYSKDDITKAYNLGFSSALHIIESTAGFSSEKQIRVIKELKEFIQEKCSA